MRKFGASADAAVGTLTKTSGSALTNEQRAERHGCPKTPQPDGGAQKKQHDQRQLRLEEGYHVADPEPAGGCRKRCQKRDKKG